MKQLVFATNNAHKLSEVRAITDGHFTILSLDDIGCHDDIPETADTLEGNALQKARYIAERYHVNCFADDTGLEVEAPLWASHVIDNAVAPILSVIPTL